jgi:hypothetical protein
LVDAQVAGEIFMSGESQPRNIASCPHFKGSLLRGDKCSEVAWNAKAPNLIGSELVRLATGWNFDNPGRERGNESPSDGCPGGSSSLVAIEQ